MIDLDHPNVLTLRGVCVDRGPIPYIVLPYMANGSLLNYLKKNRAFLLQNDSTQVSIVRGIVYSIKSHKHVYDKGIPH